MKEQFLVKKLEDLILIQENLCNIVRLNNYCEPFIIYDNINYSYLWKNKLENKLFVYNENLTNFIVKTAKLFEYVVSENFLIELNKIQKDDSCSLFHEDNNKFRLLITLCGDGGTQYTSNENINKQHLYKPFINPDEQNNKIIKNWSNITTSNVGDLLILKGKKKLNAVFHRSFPLESDIDYRYVLKMTVR